MALRSTHGTRGMTTKTAEDYWAGYFPKNKVESAEVVSKHVRKEMIGFLLLGPIGGALMIYDFIYGLESHSDAVIPPYPW
jgi:cytochrome c oxidase subunit 6a